MVAGGLGDAVPTELLQAGLREHEGDHRLGDDPRRPGPPRHRSAGGSPGPARPRRCRRSLGPSARWRWASSRRGPGAARRWTSRPRCHRSDRCGGGSPVGVAVHLVVGGRPAGAGRGETIPDLDPLIAWTLISAPASRASSRRSQWTCEPRPGGTPYARISTTPPRVSPSDWPTRPRRPWPPWRPRPGCGPGLRRARRHRPGWAGRGPRRPRRSPSTRCGRPDGCHRPARAGGRRVTEGDPRGGLPGRGPLEHRAGVGEAVLLHPDEVGVPGPRPGQRGVAGDLLGRADVTGGGERVVVDRVRAHDGPPLRPFGVAHPDRHR